MFIIKKNRNSSTLSKKEIEKQIKKAESLLNNQLSNTKQKNENLNLAEKTLLKILSSTNDLEHSFYRTVINNHLGVLYAKNGDYVKSINKFSSILLLEPNNEMIKRNLIKVANRLKENDNNSHDYQLIKDVKSDYSYARELFQNNKLEELEPIAFRLIKDYDINQQTSKWISYGNCFMGHIASNQNNYKDSIRYYIEALKLNGNNKHAEKMIMDTINEYVDYEIHRVKINTQDYKIEPETKDNIIGQKDKKIYTLQNEIKGMKEQIRTEKIKNNIKSIELREKKDTLSQKNTPDIIKDDSKDSINNSSSEDIKLLKQRLEKLEKENAEYKTNLEKANEYNQKLSNELKHNRKEVEKWKKHGKHYEKEFVKLTEQVENLIKIYQQINKKSNSIKIEETA
jgi:tetratricopeptide (TPR) repeat protein